MDLNNITYRNLSIDECDRISEIEPSQWIKKAWRRIDGQYQLIEINYMEEGWPDGFITYREALEKTLTSGGISFGAFNKKGKMVGYTTLNHDFFGRTAKYLLLDSIFVSRGYRGYGIGKQLINQVIDCAINWGADKLYTCAGSSEDTIAFYKSNGWTNASEVSSDLLEEDERDIQLEYDLKNDRNKKVFSSL